MTTLLERAPNCQKTCRLTNGEPGPDGREWLYCAKRRLSGRKPARISIDCPHEEDRLSLVRALDAFVAITDPLGRGYALAIHRPRCRRRRAWRRRGLFPGPSLRPPARFAISIAGRCWCEDQPHRNRHG